MGIEVDETSFHRAREILINKYGVENVTGSGEKNLEWEARGVDGVDGGYISFYENVAVDMFLFFGKNVGPSVEELIGVLGKPLWVFIGAQPNVFCLKRTLIYPALGIYADLDMSEAQKDIRPESRIVMIRFLQTRLSESMQVYDGYLEKWDGYSNYCE